MKKKIRNQIFLFLLLCLTWQDIGKFLTLPVGKLCNPLPIFPQIQINLLQAKQDSIVADALRETGKTLLSYFAPTQKNEAWHLDFVFLEGFPDPEPAVALALSLPSQRGMIVILQKRNNYYVLTHYEAQKTPYQKLGVLSRPDRGDILVAQKEEDPRFPPAAPFKIWFWQNHKLWGIDGVYYPHTTRT